jgi:hypothetical protein
LRRDDAAALLGRKRSRVSLDRGGTRGRLVRPRVAPLAYTSGSALVSPWQRGGRLAPCRGDPLAPGQQTRDRNRRRTGVLGVELDRLDAKPLG